jgi:hypothetical protein
MDNEDHWSVEEVLLDVAGTLRNDGLLTIDKESRAQDEVWWRVTPANQDAMKILVREFPHGAELFLGEVDGPFEIDFDDPRDRLEFERVLNAVLDGKIEWELARTLAGERPVRLIWPTGSWTVIRPLGLDLIRFGKRRVRPAAYRTVTDPNL